MHVLVQRIIVVEGTPAEGAVGVRRAGVRLQCLCAGEGLEFQWEQAALLSEGGVAGGRTGESTVRKRQVVA